MAHPVKTQALAAYIKSRNLTFAGASLTLRQLGQLLLLAPDALHNVTVDEDVLVRIAQHLKIGIEDLVQAVAAMPPAASTRAKTAPGVPVPVPVPVPTPTVTIPAPPAPAAAIPEPPMLAEEVVPADEPEINVTFDDVEATPLPTVPDAANPPKKSKKKSKSR